MIKIAIVEDERLEREAIKLLLSRMPIATEVAYEAFQGDDAVRLFRVHRPDLVLMDIQLPRLSGLEAAKQIRTIDPETEIVILSAYNEFSFAQQALQLGAIDYLLKPYNEEKLYSVVFRVSRKLASKRIQKEKTDLQARLMCNVERYMKQELFSFLVAGRVLDEDSGAILSDYFHLKGSGLRCMLLRTGVLDDEQWKEMRLLLISSLRPVICRPLQRDIVMLVPDASGPDPDRTAAALAKPLLNAAQSRTLRCLAGGPERDLQGISASFHRLCEQMDGGEEEKKLRSQEIMKMYDLESQFYHCMLRRDWVKSKQILTRLGAIADGINHGQIQPTRAYFGYLWRQMDRFVYQATGRRRSTKLKLSIDTQLEQAQTLEQLIETLMSFFQWYIDALELDSCTHSKKIVEDVKEYVNANLAQDLSLERMGEIVGFSSYYLSKQFKKVEGISYKNYVISVRMEKAKQLLAGSNMKINQVAAAVGYADANYFSRAFRDYTGISSKDFGDR